MRKAGVMVLSPEAGSWLSSLPAVVRLAAISKASPSHTRLCLCSVGSKRTLVSVNV